MLLLLTSILQFFSSQIFLIAAKACALGKKLEVPTYQFLKEPLIRKYGEEFYDALDKVAKMQAGKKETTVK